MRPIDVPGRGDGHAAPITHVACRDDRVATCSYDGSAIAWRLEGRRLVPGHRVWHRRLVNAAAWHPTDPSVLATASADKTAAVWRLGDGGAVELVAVLARHTDDVNAVAWLPDGRRLVAVSEDGTASLWDALAGRFLGFVARHGGHCMMTAVSGDGLVATVGEDGVVNVGDPDRPGSWTGRAVGASVEGCAWSPAGDVLALARDDGRLELVDRSLATRSCATVGSSAVRCVVWLVGRRLGVGGYDGTVRIVDTAGRVLHTFHDERLWPRSVAAGPGGVLAGSFWSSPFVVDPATGKAVVEPAAPTEGPNALAVGGGRLHVGLDSGAVVSVPLDALVAPSPIADAASVERPSSSPVLSLAVAGGVRYVGTYGGEVLALGADGTLRARAQLGAPVPSLAAADGRVVAGTYGGELVELAPGDLAVVDRRAAHDGSVKSLAFVPGTGLLSAATDGRVAVGDGCRDRTVLWEHGNLVNAVAAHGDVVASASRDHTVVAGRVVRGATGWHVEGRTALLGADESVKCVAVVAAGPSPVVVAGSYDFNVYAWSFDDPGAATLRAGAAVHTFRQAACTAVAAGPAAAVVGSWDHELAVVTARPDGVSVTRTVAVDDLLEGR